MKTCDTCDNFFRWHQIEGSLGLCEKNDWRIDKVQKNCKYYNSKKYNRNKQKSKNKRVQNEYDNE